MHTDKRLNTKDSALRRRARWLMVVAVGVAAWAVIAELGVRSSNAQLIAAPILTVVAFGVVELVVWVTARVGHAKTQRPIRELKEIQAGHDVNLAGVVIGVLTLILGLILEATVGSVLGGVIAIASLAYVMYLMYGGIFR